MRWLDGYGYGDAAAESFDDNGHMTMTSWWLAISLMGTKKSVTVKVIKKCLINSV